MLGRLGGVALFLVCVLGANQASAQGSATLDRFRASETPEDDFHISRASDLGHLRVGAMLHFDYSNDPLVWRLDVDDPSTERASIVRHHLVGTLGLSLGLADRVVVFAGLPATLLMSGDDAMVLGSVGAPLGADGSGLGDAYVGARVRLFGELDDAFALALQGTLTIPTSGTQRLRGDGFLSGLPELIASIRPGGGSRIVLNVGAYIRENVDPIQNLTFQDELLFGLGFAVPVFTSDSDPRTHLDLHAQIYGSTPFSDFFGAAGTALEAMAGLKLFHQSGVVFGAAGGPGITSGFGSPDFRLVLMLGWMTPPEPDDRDGDGIVDDDDECPDDPEDFDEFEDEDGCPDRDNDRDGILDVDDSCPMRPENINNFEDEDGCPDEIGDTDGDGLPDPVDDCPTEPEDIDDFEDDDGCPDPDNDQDHILDVDDSCPMLPEDPDGFEDEDGCPDPDNDQDTVLDVEDNCPNEPGPPENQGCRRRQRVRISGGTIEILDKVYFRTNKAEIRSRSFPLLSNVAQVLNNHPEIQQVRVEGHTDSRGSHDHNMDLSQRRAEAVVTWLVDRGDVTADRLTAVGYGPDRPIVPDATSRDQHAQNRRVEFHIVGAADGEIEHSDNEATDDTIDY